MALKERILLQRINLVIIIAVLLAVVAVYVQVMMSQQRTAEALSAIAAEIGRLKDEAAAKPAGSIGVNSGTVFIEGDVQRTGVYQLPSTGRLTLKRLIASAGGVVGSDDARIIVTKIGTNGKLITRFCHERTLSDPTADLDLEPDDHVHVGRYQPMIVTTAPATAATNDVPSPPIEQARPEDIQFPKISPFREVRWKDWTPFVNLDGTWGELVSINGIPLSEIIEHCHKNHAGQERKRFSEDLVQVMTEMGKAPGTQVKVQFKDLKTGSLMSIGEAPMTEGNHERVVRANDAADDRAPLWGGEPPMMSPQ